MSEILEFNAAGTKLVVRPYRHNDHYWQVYFDTNKALPKWAAPTTGRSRRPIRCCVSPLIAPASAQTPTRWAFFIQAPAACSAMVNSAAGHRPLPYHRTISRRSAPACPRSGHLGQVAVAETIRLGRQKDPTPRRQPRRIPIEGRIARLHRRAAVCQPTAASIAEM